ncbi:MAG: SRPBCC domain-containing protein [Crocinitomicaceae bacterium]|nr:SRPBCC domain-containing protein [Crocinitomicaceae bacterium]
MKETLELSTIIHATPETIYNAWLSSEGHTAMTGGEAECTNEVGDSYSAWDGYITGTNTKLTPHSTIEQTWRTSEFSEDDEDSHLIVQLKEHASGTEVTLIHTNIPEGQTQYENGWKEHYFAPMGDYFND